LSVNKLRKFTLTPNSSTSTTVVESDSFFSAELIDRLEALVKDGMIIDISSFRMAGGQLNGRGINGSTLAVDGIVA